MGINIDMITVKLCDHGINVTMHQDAEFIETEKGIWLEDNNIDYRICSIVNILAMNIDGKTIDAISIENMSFFSEEDFMAFKLRWSNQ